MVFDMILLEHATGADYSTCRFCGESLRKATGAKIYGIYSACPACGAIGGIAPDENGDMCMYWIAGSVPQIEKGGKD